MEFSENFQFEKFFENSKEFSLMQILLEESEQYKNYVLENNYLKSELEKEENSGNIRTVGIFTHTEHIQTRLEFFRYVIVTIKYLFSLLEISFLKKTWNIYVENSVNKNEREISLEWFGSILQPLENFGGKQEMIDFIFLVFFLKFFLFLKFFYQFFFLLRNYFANSSLFCKGEMQLKHFFGILQA